MPGMTDVFAFIIEAVDIYRVEKKREKKIEKLKHLSPEDILKVDGWNFSIPYSIIEKVETKKFERGLVKVGWMETKIDIRFKKEYKTQVLVPTYIKFGWIPWKRLKLTSASQFSMTIVKPGFDESVNLVRSVLADKLFVS